MKARWQHERDVIKNLQAKKEKLDQLKTEAERLQRTGDFARASEIRRSFRCCAISMRSIPANWPPWTISRNWPSRA